MLYDRDDRRGVGSVLGAMRIAYSAPAVWRNVTRHASRFVPARIDVGYGLAFGVDHFEAARYLLDGPIGRGVVAMA
jgi:hypothetical protein